MHVRGSAQPDPFQFPEGLQEHFPNEIFGGIFLAEEQPNSSGPCPLGRCGERN